MKDTQQTKDSNHCGVCDCTFENQDELQQHILTRSHIKRNSRFNSLYISGIPEAPNVVNDLLQFLSQIGDIERFKILGDKENKILVEFQKRDTVKLILSKGVHINNVNLHVYQAKLTHDDDCAHSFSYEAIKTVFSAGTFEEQLSNFIEKICLTEEDIENNYEPICQNLEELFKPIFPKCKIVKFGSSVTGLGFKKCDLDVYLDTGIPIIRSDKKTIIGPHLLSSDTLFGIVEKTIRENYKKFTRCIPIPTARVPIVKCFYNPTSVSCDISFKSKLGIYNSRLLKFYLTIDPRFKPLMIILKYWYYNCELRSYIGITKYALTVLYIFYLQKLKLVPTANALKEKCALPLVINSWQVNHSESLNDFQMNEDCPYKSVPELLQKFFEFYMSYDFQNNVACPCDGQTYSKELFYEIESLPDSMNRYKEYVNGTADCETFNLCRPMCVQDPTELNWNVTNNVSANRLDKFQLFCFISANITMNSSNSNYKNLLNDLFGFPNKSVINNAPTAKEIKSFSIHPYDIYDMPTKSKTLCFENDWIDSTFNLIHRYLEQILNFEIKVNNNSSQSDQNVEKKLLVLNCQGSHCLWRNRKSAKTTVTSVDQNTDPFQKEINISKYLLSQMDPKSDSALIINFECRLEEKNEPKTRIFVTLSNIEGVESLYTEIAHDLMYRMPSVLRKFLRFTLTNKS